MDSNSSGSLGCESWQRCPGADCGLQMDVHPLQSGQNFERTLGLTSHKCSRTCTFGCFRITGLLLLTRGVERAFLNGFEHSTGEGRGRSLTPPSLREYSATRGKEDVTPTMGAELNAPEQLLGLASFPAIPPGGFERARWLGHPAFVIVGQVGPPNWYAQTGCKL